MVSGTGDRSKSSRRCTAMQTASRGTSSSTRSITGCSVDTTAVTRLPCTNRGGGGYVFYRRNSSTHLKPRDCRGMVGVVTEKPNKQNSTFPESSERAELGWFAILRGKTVQPSCQLGGIGVVGRTTTPAGTRIPIQSIDVPLLVTSNISSK